MAKYHGIKTLSEMYSSKNGVSQKKSEEIIRSVLSIFEEGIADTNYEGVQFNDFLTLKRVTRKETVGRNPKTKLPCVIPSRVGVKASLGKRFSLSLGNDK